MLLQVFPFSLLLQFIFDRKDHEWKGTSSNFTKFGKFNITFLTAKIKEFLLAISYFRVAILECTLQSFETSQTKLWVLFTSSYDLLSKFQCHVSCCKNLLGLFMGFGVFEFREIWARVGKFHEKKHKRKTFPSYSK